MGRQAMERSIKMRPAAPAGAATGRGGSGVAELGAVVAGRSGLEEEKEAAPARRGTGWGRAGPASPRSRGPAGVAAAAQ